MLGNYISFSRTGLFTLFFIFYANAAILENQQQITQEAADFIQALSKEIYQKTSVHLHLVAIKNLGNMTLEEWKSSYQMYLKEPYVVLFFSKKEKKIDIITTQDTHEMFDKKEVYWDYIVPLIPRSDKELTPENISILLVNGFVDIADRIASFYGIELEHGFTKINKGGERFSRIILYTMLFILLLLFAFASLKSKKNHEYLLALRNFSIYISGCCVYCLYH